jgi:FKBP-type peptidyl-prolyl cis-trans isomerase FklB
MRRFLTVVVLSVTFIIGNIAISQDNPNPGGQPGGQPKGGEEAPQGAPAGAQGAKDPNYMSQVSYALGRNFAMNLKENGIDCEINSLVAGISDVLKGAQPQLSDEQCSAVLQRFSQEMQQREKGRMDQEGQKNQREEQAFLTQNKGKPGVQTTPSGLQYRVLTQGQGASPTINDTVKCNYRGTLLNGTEFDASARHGGPAEFPVKGVIPGWTEALQKMHVGDKWQLFVPAKLAYGMNPPGPPIEAGSLLVFEIELLDIAK